MSKEVERETWQGDPIEPLAFSRESTQDYLEQYLKKKFPEWSDKEIRREAKTSLEDGLFREFVMALQEFDAKISREHPELNWTTWFDEL